MNILITSAETRLSQELAASLGATHRVRLTATSNVESGLPQNAEFVLSELNHDSSTNDLVRGMDAIVHSGHVDPDASESDQLDAALRHTYNLLWAATEEGVSRVVYLGSLSVLDKYDEDYVVTERWKPVPTTDVPVLGYHLGEFICKEFAREHKVRVISLRLGHLLWGGDTGDTSGLFPKDAVQAIEKALAVDTSDWGQYRIFHVQSDVPDARFLTRSAQEVLGYRPSSQG